MTKQHTNISNVEELEQLERRLRRRIKATETELGARVKQIPEEMLSTLLMKVVSAVVDGKAIKSVVGIAKKIGKSAIFRIFQDDSE